MTIQQKCEDGNFTPIFPKVLNDDGHLESLNDKQCACRCFSYGCKSSADQIRLKVFYLSDLTKLDHLKKCISKMTDVLEVYSKDFKIPFNTYKRRLQSFPNILNIREVHQYELVYIFSCLANTCEKIAKFCTTSKDVKCLNNCTRATSKISMYLQRHIMENEVFHVKLHPQPKRKCTNFY